MRLYSLGLDSEALFRVKVMDAYREMRPKNVRYLCKLFGIGKSTFYRWKARYRSYNLTTLVARPRKPRRLKTVPWNVVVEVCTWKRENPQKSHYYLYNLWVKDGKTPPCSPKTIYNWWRRRGLIIQRHRRKRRKTRLFNQATLPGELIQIDTKFLDGRKRFQYTAIDVVSKWKVARAYSRLNQANTLDFLDRLLNKAREKGLRIQRVQTDNGLEFQSEVTKYLASIGIHHQYTWIHTPDQNGIVERSHRTDEEEFYQLKDTKYLTLEELNLELEEWIEYYNNKRLHFSLNFATPEEYLVSHM